MAERRRERIGRALFAAGLRLLPSALRREVGPDMADTFATRQRDAVGRGSGALLALWLREAAGLLAARRARASEGTAPPPPAGAPRSATGSRRTSATRLARSRARSPAFTATAVVVLALGVGATTGIFSAVNAVILRPLPFADPERLVMLWEKNPDRGWFKQSAAPANALDWRERVEAFTDVALYDELQFGLTFVGGEGAEQLPYTMVSGNFFNVLGVHPAVGDDFTWDDTWQTPHPRVVLSWDTWTTRFGADPDVVGSVADFAGAQVEIAGVAPRGFAFPTPQTRIWMAYGWDPTEREEVFFRSAH